MEKQDIKTKEVERQVEDTGIQMSDGQEIKVYVISRQLNPEKFILTLKDVVGEGAVYSPNAEV